MNLKITSLSREHALQSTTEHFKVRLYANILTNAVRAMFVGWDQIEMAWWRVPNVREDKGAVVIHSIVINVTLLALCTREGWVGIVIWTIAKSRSESTRKCGIDMIVRQLNYLRYSYGKWKSLSMGYLRRLWFFTYKTTLSLRILDLDRGGDETCGFWDYEGAGFKIKAPHKGSKVGKLSCAPASARTYYSVRALAWPSNAIRKWMSWGEKHCLVRSAFVGMCWKASNGIGSK